MEIGNILRESRINSKMSVKQVSDILTEQGHKASEKTVYSWENNNSRPDIEILMKLCDIYGIRDILKTFGFNGYKEDGSIQLNMKEIDIIEKYRFLKEKSPDGMKIVDTILDREYSIAIQMQEKEKHIEKLKTEMSEEFIPTRIISYYQRLASAGTGEYLFDDIPNDKIKVPLDSISEKADFAIGINGRSMETKYYDGEKVFVKKTPDVLPGEIGVFIIGEDCYIKKLGHNELISLNPDKETYPNIEVKEQEMRIVGKVIGKVDEIVR